MSKLLWQRETCVTKACLEDQKPKNCLTRCTMAACYQTLSSALNHLDLSGREVPSGTTLPVLQLKIELRNVKAQLVICFRMWGDPLPSQFSQVEDAIGGILLHKLPSYHESSGADFISWIYEYALPEVRGLAKQLADGCQTSPLTVADVVAIADIILENVADFGVVLDDFMGEHVLEFVKVDVIDTFVTQVTFLKALLVFAKATGVELQGLLIYFQPFAINVACVFISDHEFWDWCEEVRSNCLAVIGIATAPQVYKAYTQALSTSTSSAAPASILESFLDSLVLLLWDGLRNLLNSRIKDQFKVLYEMLRFCRSLLKQKPRGFDGEIRDQIGVLVCGAGMLVCSLHHTHVELSYPRWLLERLIGLLRHTHVEISYPDRLLELLYRFDVLQIQVGDKAFESRAPTTDELGSGNSAYILEDIMISDGSEETVILSHNPGSSSAPQITGFQDDEANSVLNQLTRGSKQLQIIPICGMAGVGKTTFASALYNHRPVIYHFQAHAWCPISQVLDKKNVLLQLLNQLIPESEAESYTKRTEDDLANKLRKCLKGKRYLVVLDDVWTTEAWHSLAASFPDDSTQSRIILTSRHHDIVPGQQPHLLRLRDDNECLEILKMKSFHKEGWTSEFGMTIAKMCKGLPLTAVIVAGLLGTTKQQGWNGILDHLSSGGVSGEKQCNRVLELSFKHLPDHLKPCFLYFAAFPEDEEIYLKRMLRLWIGEGFVRESESMRIEDVAQEYMENLIQRSLVLVAQNRSLGGVKTCRIHDLIRDFCLRKSEQKNFFHILLQGDDELSDFNEPPSLRRLSIHSDPIHFKEAKLFCPRAHSMLFFSTGTSNIFNMVFIVQIFKLLTVLDILAIRFNAGIPSEIELLTQLRYLSINCSLYVIPSSLENLENSSALLELETLCGVVFDSSSSMEQQMRKFPNIRRLKFSIQFGAGKIVIPDFLNQLRCLSISGIGRLQCEFGSSQVLRRLSLYGFQLSSEEIADIGKLPNLEVLKLEVVNFLGNTLDMEEGEFSKLRYLKLMNIRMKRWTVSDEQLPCLEKLLLIYCDILEELPSDFLKTSATLEEIEVRECSPNVEDFAREIWEAQEDYGNVVKVHITTKM